MVVSFNCGVLYLFLIIIYIVFIIKFNLIFRIEMKKIFIFEVINDELFIFLRKFKFVWIWLFVYIRDFVNGFWDIEYLGKNFEGYGYFS